MPHMADVGRRGDIAFRMPLAELKKRVPKRLYFHFLRRHHFQQRLPRRRRELDAHGLSSHDTIAPNFKSTRHFRKSYSGMGCRESFAFRAKRAPR